MKRKRFSVEQIVADALKATTLRAVIGAATPVFGLRPGRSRFWRTANLPKP